MNNKNIAFFLFFAIFSVSTHAMDHNGKGQLSKIKTRFLTNKDDIPGTIVKFLKNKENKNVTMNAFVITNPRVISAINERSDSVTGTIGGHYMTNLSKVPGLQVDPDEHGKNWVSEKNCLATTTNPTNMIYKYGNKEVMVSVKNDQALAKNMRTLMESTSPVKEKKEIVFVTPEKNTAYSSRKTALALSHAQRILNFTKRHKKNPKADDFVWAGTMNFANKKMAKALAESAEENIDTRLLVNKSAITKNGIPLLEKVYNAGGKVKVYDPEEKKRSIMHIKQLITPDLLGIFNANFTPEGDRQNNIDTYFPHNKKLIEESKENFEEVWEESVDWKEALPLHNKAQEDKTKKRKAAKEAQSAPAQKKKKTT